MSDAAAHASASATRSGLGIGVLAHSGQSTYADEELTATLPVEEQAVEHICFLAKQANTSTEVRLTVKDTVAELKAVSLSGEHWIPGLTDRLWPRVVACAGLV